MTQTQVRIAKIKHELITRAVTRTARVNPLNGQKRLLIWPKKDVLLHFDYGYGEMILSRIPTISQLKYLAGPYDSSKGEYNVKS